MLGSAPGATIGGEPAGREPPPRPLPPTAPSALGQNPGPAPSALAGDFGRRQRREGKALTRASRSRVRTSLPRSNTPALRVTSLSRPRSPGLHTGLSSHLGRQRVARSSASAAEPGTEPSASGVTFSPHRRPASPAPAAPPLAQNPEPAHVSRNTLGMTHSHQGTRYHPSVCSSQLLPQLRRPLPPSPHRESRPAVGGSLVTKTDQLRCTLRSFTPLLQHQTPGTQGQHRLHTCRSPGASVNSALCLSPLHPQDTSTPATLPIPVV